MDLTRIVDGIAANAGRACGAEAGDYIVDGLLYCHKCNTKKQTVVGLLGKKRTVPCLCRCAAEQRDREEAERKAQEFRERVRRNRKDGFPQSDMQDWTFAADDRSDERTSKAMMAYVEHFPELRKDGRGLILYGKCGSGKTFASACVVNALIDQGYPCMMTNFARVANTVSGMYAGKQEYLDSLNRYSLLVLDDLGAERDTEYMGEIVYNIVDSRYRANLPMIITSNLSGEDLKHPKGINEQRVFNRILEKCFPVEVNGADRRRKKIIQEYDGMKELLGLSRS